MLAQRKTYSTLAESLAYECKAKSETEFFSDELDFMAGSRNRNLIITNLTREISHQLKSAPCELYSKDMRVKIPVTRSYIYPDIVVVCGEPKFESDYEGTLLNPLLIIEVISKATESYCRNKKFNDYRTIESFTEYLLVAQNKYETEQYVKQPDGQWLFLTMSSPKDTLELFTLQCTLTLDEVYNKVRFPK